jgi:hypothetical protein
LATTLCVKQCWIKSEVSSETIRQTLRRLGNNGKRVKHWITRPDPLYCKKTARDRLIAWASAQPSCAIGFLYEVWWSSIALPRLHAWQDTELPVRLLEQTWQKGDPDPKALACYGVLWQHGPAADPIRKQISRASSQDVQ